MKSSEWRYFIKLTIKYSFATKMIKRLKKVEKERKNTNLEQFLEDLFSKLSIGALFFVITSSVITHFFNPSRVGISYIKSRIEFSIIDLRPLAPVSRLIASFAIQIKDSFVNSNSTSSLILTNF